MSAVPRAARALVRVAALLAPAGARERMRREWEAELAAAAERGEDGGALFRTAWGAFADARALRSLEWSRRTRSEDLMSGWTQGWLREIRVAARSLLRAPAYSAVAVLTLAIGLGGSAAIYTLLERVVLDPLPYPEPERLLRVDNVVPGVDPEARWSTSSAQYVYLTDHSEALDQVGIYRLGGANLQTPSGAERVHAATITAEVLDLLGARAERGRLMTVDDNLPGAAPVVVLSHGFWTRALGADPDVVGRTIQLDDGPFEVVGVLAPGTEPPDAAPGSTTDVWRPLTIDRAGEFYNNHAYRMLGRLAPGADTTAAEAEITRLTARLPEAFPLAYSQAFFERYGFRTEVTPLKSAVIGDAAQSLWILFAGVGLVLVIACANVANLFLVRMEARRRELAVRAALGAGRVQVARYLVAEGLVLAGSGAALALLFASQAMRAITAVSLEGLPRAGEVSLGGGTVLFTVALSLLAGLGLAVHPLLVHTRGGPAGALAEGGRSGSGGPSGSRFRSALVVTQVAMALVLAVSAGLLIESMRKLTRVDPGIDPDGVLTLQLNLTTARYPDDPSLWRFYAEALERLRAVPGVVAAGMSEDLPLSGGFGCTIQAFEDAAVAERLRAAGLTSCAGEELTTPGYFDAMGIPLLSGRGLERADSDDPTRGAVVVSRAFAERFWPGEDPLGKRVSPSGRSRGYHTVVGVVGDVPSETVEGDRAIAVYYPVVVNPATDLTLWPGTMNLVVKTGLDDPTSLVPSIRQAIAEVDASVPITNVRLARDLIGQSMARLSFTALLLGVAAGTALLLAAVGLYGVLSYAVTRRTREIGMRIAIGARPGQVEWMVVAQSLGLACVGLLLGLAAAFAGTRVLDGLLYGVEPTDPVAFGGAAALLLMVALVASWIPARRAARVDPSVALREG